MFESFNISNSFYCEFAVCNLSISFDFVYMIVSEVHSSTILQLSEVSKLFLPSSHVSRTATVDVPLRIVLFLVHDLKYSNRFRNTDPNLVGTSRRIVLDIWNKRCF